MEWNGGGFEGLDRTGQCWGSTNAGIVGSVYCRFTVSQGGDVIASSMALPVCGRRARRNKISGASELATTAIKGAQDSEKHTIGRGLN